MKSFLLPVLALALLVTPAFADFGEKQFERAKASATSQGKLIAIFFEQGYSDPNCPKCITRVDGSNERLKKAVARKHVVFVTVDPKEKVDASKLPDIVKRAAASRSGLVILSSDGSKEIGYLKALSTKDEIEAFDKKVAEAVLK